MKRLVRIAAMLAAVAVASTAHAGRFDRYDRLPLPKLSPPAARVVVLENGIRCFLLEDHTLPMVQMKVIARAGAIHDPADELGLAELTGMLMRSGGAGERSPEAFDAAVDGLGAVLSAGFNRETGDFGLMVLSGDLEQGAGLLFDMLFRPRFDPARLATARGKAEEALRREDDDPGSVASRHFRQLVYGKESPWARRESRATLRRIGVDGIRRFHGEALRTGNLLLAAAGDFDTEKLLALVRRLSAGAPAGVPSFAPVPEVALAFAPGEDNVVRPLTQSFIRMGHLGIRRHNPDKYALLLMTDILGAGSFKSRLMEDIRTKRGMAYSIWSDLSPGTDYGTFVVGGDTKAKQAGEVVELIRGHIARLASSGDVTPEELEFARRSVLSRLIFEFDSAFKVVDRRATFHLYGFPDDYWRVFRDRIAAVTRADIRDVATRYLHPDGLKTVVVGPRPAAPAAAKEGTR